MQGECADRTSFLRRLEVSRRAHSDQQAEGRPSASANYLVNGTDGAPSIRTGPRRNLSAGWQRGRGRAQHRLENECGRVDGGDRGTQAWAVPVSQSRCQQTIERLNELSVQRPDRRCRAPSGASLLGGATRGLSAKPRRSTAVLLIPAKRRQGSTAYCRANRLHHVLTTGGPLPQCPALWPSAVPPVTTDMALLESKTAVNYAVRAGVSPVPHPKKRTLAITRRVRTPHEIHACRSDNIPEGEDAITY